MMARDWLARLSYPCPKLLSSEVEAGLLGLSHFVVFRRVTEEQIPDPALQAESQNAAAGPAAEVVAASRSQEHLLDFLDGPGAAAGA